MKITDVNDTNYIFLEGIKTYAENFGATCEWWVDEYDDISLLIHKEEKEKRQYNNPRLGRTSVYVAETFSLRGNKIIGYDRKELLQREVLRKTQELLFGKEDIIEKVSKGMDEIVKQKMEILKERRNTIQISFKKSKELNNG